MIKTWRKQQAEAMMDNGFRGHNKPWAKGTRLHKIWWYSSDECPLWIWRPYCWFKGEHTNDGYGSCVFCRKPVNRT